MAWEVGRYFRNGWIYLFWLDPRILFKYYGFLWVHPWPGHWLYVHWAALGIFGLFAAEPRTLGRPYWLLRNDEPLPPREKRYQMDE
jgi:vitamin K-dependent gamma-carboxylase-like protein